MTDLRRFLPGHRSDTPEAFHETNARIAVLEIQIIGGFLDPASNGATS